MLHRSRVESSRLRQRLLTQPDLKPVSSQNSTEADSIYAALGHGGQRRRSLLGAPRTTVRVYSRPMSEQPPAPPQYSPDGRYWWDGQKWIPVSAPPPAQAMETEVVHYRDGVLATATRKFNKDSKDRIAQGWRIVGQSQSQFGVHKSFTVTYERPRPQAAPG